MGKIKQPKIQSIPKDRTVRAKENPDSYLSGHPSWNFNRADQSGRWSFNELSLKNIFWTEIFQKLKDFEKMTWSDIVMKSSDKHHAIPVPKLNKVARDRLDELKIYEEEIFSLRLTGNHRIYGIRYGTVLSIIWYDTDHGDNDTCVCRSHLKHT